MNERKRLGGYELLEELGSGGMGQVFRARQLSLNRLVALKVLHGDQELDSVLQARFRREAEVQQGLHHPHLVTLYDWGSIDGKQFLALELVEGQDLARALEDGGPPAPDFIVRVAIRVASALAYLHQQRILHRDLKPPNILISPRGWVKVTDFGLCRAIDQATLTREGAMMGTPRYISPEGARGERATTASDVYSLGMTMYQMAAGRFPYEASDIVQWLAAIQGASPRPLTELRSDLPALLVDLIHPMLAKNPAERPELGEILEILQKLERTLGLEAATLYEVPAVDPESARVRRVTRRSSPTPPRRASSALSRTLPAGSPRRALLPLGLASAMLAALGALAWTMGGRTEGPPAPAGPASAPRNSPSPGAFADPAGSAPRASPGRLSLPAPMLIEVAAALEALEHHRRWRQSQDLIDGSLPAADDVVEDRTRLDPSVVARSKEDIRRVEDLVARITRGRDATSLDVHSLLLLVQLREYNYTITAWLISRRLFESFFSTSLQDRPEGDGFLSGIPPAQSSRELQLLRKYLDCARETLEALVEEPRAPRFFPRYCHGFYVVTRLSEVVPWGATLKDAARETRGALSRTFEGSPGSRPHPLRPLVQQILEFGAVRKVGDEHRKLEARVRHGVEDLVSAGYMAALDGEEVMELSHFDILGTH